MSTEQFLCSKYRIIQGGGPMALLALLALEIWKIWVQSAKSAKSAKKFFNQNRVYLRKFRKNQFSKLAFIRSEIC